MMIIQATKRFFGTRVWRGLRGPGTRQESVAGRPDSWISRRSIFQSTVEPQVRSPDSKPDPMEFIKKMERMFTAAMARKGRSGRFEVVWFAKMEEALKDKRKSLLQTVKLDETSGECQYGKTVWKDERDEYFEFVKALSDGGLLREDLQKLFTGFVEGAWAGVKEYEPWRQLLERLFPSSFGYEVSLEKILKHTYEEKGSGVDEKERGGEEKRQSVVKVEDWFLVVRQQTANGRHVRLLACGFDGHNKDPEAESGLHRLPYRLESMACGLFQSGQALVSVPVLAFCGTMFNTGNIHRSSSRRMIEPDCGHVQREDGWGQRCLVQLAHLVHSLQFTEVSDLESLRDCDWQFCAPKFVMD